MRLLHLVLLDVGLTVVLAGFFSTPASFIHSHIEKRGKPWLRSNMQHTLSLLNLYSQGVCRGEKEFLYTVSTRCQTNRD